MPSSDMLVNRDLALRSSAWASHNVASSPVNFINPQIRNKSVENKSQESYDSKLCGSTRTPHKRTALSELG